MIYSIGEFSKLTNISIYTLRYYEIEKLIMPNRLENGRRFYTDLDITWIGFIKKLKDTGMPIREIQKYAELRGLGNDTMTERMEILIHHRSKLKVEIKELQEHLKNLDVKIDFYKSNIKKMK